MKITLLLAAALASIAAAVPAASSFDVDLTVLGELVAESQVSAREEGNVLLEARAKCASQYTCVGGRCTRIQCNSTGTGTTCITFKGGKC